MELMYVDLCDPPIKKIYDCVHGFIYLSKFATMIIDNKYFQRLRDLKQLGTCVYVYPNANHSRFEHSLGTYHVASKLLEKLPNQVDKNVDEYLGSINELKKYYKKMYNDEFHPLDLYVCELIKIAALCHDLGHGPFSHVFDDVFLPRVGMDKQINSTHEERSGLILRKIINDNQLLNSIVDENEIQFMINLINPQNNHTGFIYQIVSNNLTSLDVDKFDYLQRDIYSLNFNAKISAHTMVEQVKIIDNNFVYPEQSANDIIDLFTTRHRLHTQVYCHKVTISTQIIMVEIFMLLDKILGLSSSINDVDKFCNMTEGYILNSIKILETKKELLNSSEQEKLTKAKNLLDNLESRQLYPMIYHFVSKKKVNLDEYFKDFDDKDNILVFQNKVGFVSGNKPNPLDSIYLYKTKNVNKSNKLTWYKKNKEEISLIIPNLYQEYIIIIYYKVKSNVERINELQKYCHDMFQTIN